MSRSVMPFCFNYKILSPRVGWVTGNHLNPPPYNTHKKTLVEGAILLHVSSMCAFDASTYEEDMIIRGLCHLKYFIKYLESPIHFNF